MSNPFSNQMSDLTDAELLRVLDIRDDYQPEAIAAAEAELQSRNLAPEQIAKVQNELALLQRQQESLPMHLKVVYFLLPFGIITWHYANKFKKEGYDKKYQSSWLMMKFGAAFYLGLFAFFKALQDGTIRLPID